MRCLELAFYPLAVLGTSILESLLPPPKSPPISELALCSLSAFLAGDRDWCTDEEISSGKKIEAGL